MKTYGVKRSQAICLSGADKTSHERHYKKQESKRSGRAAIDRAARKSARQEAKRLIDQE
jgi:hypothetical protein